MFFHIESVEGVFQVIDDFEAPSVYKNIDMEKRTGLAAKTAGKRVLPGKEKL